jgi:hypothetical protein
MLITKGRWGVAAVLLVMACAGGPKHKVDESILKDIPVQQKQAMLDAKAEMDRASEERDLAQAQFTAAKQEADLAKTTRAQARLEVGKDQTRLDAAEKVKDADAIRDAKERIRVSDMAVAGSDARLDWLAQRQKVHQAEATVADSHMRVASAHYELEKARLAERENRFPNENFRVSQFEQQVADAVRQGQAAEGELQAQRAQSARLRDVYAQLAHQYNEQRLQVPGPEPSLILPLPIETLRAKAPGRTPM